MMLWGTWNNFGVMDFVRLVILTGILSHSERELLHKVFTEKRAGIYVGIDPTAPSMHVGHMLPFMVLAWGYVWGLPVTFLVRSRKVRVYSGMRLMITVGRRYFSSR